jgi:hypothetical protein
MSQHRKSPCSYQNPIPALSILLPSQNTKYVILVPKMICNPHWVQARWINIIPEVPYCNFDICDLVHNSVLKGSIKYQTVAQYKINTYFNGQMKKIQRNGTAINMSPKTDTWQTKMYWTVRKSHKHMCDKRQFHFIQGHCQMGLSQKP